MRLGEIIREGGWDATVTQGTVIKPAIVKSVLEVVHHFVDGFNSFIADKGVPPIKVGYPTGSSAYYDVDSQEDPDKIYGDVDLQMIAPAVPDANTYGAFTSFWNKLTTEYIQSVRLPYVHSESKPGHPILQIGAEQWVQVDFMWHEEKTAHWGRFRATPERGVKGLLNGNMFSVLGELLNMSIQHAGVQIKTVDGKHVSFQKQKGTTVETLSTTPEKFVLHILGYLFMDQYGEDKMSYLKVDPLLQSNPGVSTSGVKVATLVNAVKGLARSFELNKMYGKRALSEYANADEFIQAFYDRYTEKAIAEVGKAKRDKAETPDAIARAEDDKKKVMSGLKMVQDLFYPKEQVEEESANATADRYTKLNAMKGAR